ncbi:MAG: type II toxin-antitoxin system RelE/ParE family toxin, partial [Proteobacteria bacterium]|nr:type II toxin-antitoxin system RelE/ParE family toxin [Pseudomonadota bacterium]
MTAVWRVVVTPRAAADLADAHAWLQARNPRAAADWLASMRETILNLAAMPQAHPRAPESHAFDVEVRRAVVRHGRPWSVYFTLEIA